MRRTHVVSLVVFLTILANSAACAAPAKATAARKAPPAAKRAATPTAAPAPKPAPVDKGSLTGEIRRLAGVSGLAGMRVGIRVESLGPEKGVVYEQNADQQFKPASNQKILTTAAAMTLLPPDFTYRTILGRRGEDLVVIGGGDPSMGDPKLSQLAREPITAVFHKWAEELKAKGITEIRGDLIYDDFVFDHEFVNPTWRGQFNLQDYYTAPVGGLNFNDNCVDILTRPGEGGGPAVVTLVPDTPFVKLDNRSKTAKSGQPNIRLATTQPYTIAVSGSVSTPSGSSGISIAVTDPGAFFASTCRTALAAQGITIHGETRRQRVRPAGGQVPSDVQVIAVFDRKLKDILWRVDKSSLNMFAEAVLKTVGAYAGRDGTPGLGSNETGRAAFTRFLEQLGIPANTYVIADGSGLSHSNRTTPAVLATILRFMDTHPLRDEFRSNLAVPGESEGTLRRRMKELKGKMVGKTGYISGVSALSGYVEGPGARRYAFSVLCNDINKAKGGLGAARTLEDSICRTLASWGSSTAATAASGDAASQTQGRQAPGGK